MLKPSSALSFCLSSLLVSGCAVGNESTAPTEVVSTAKHWMSEAQVPGVALAKIEHGQVQWISTLGERAPGKPLQADTVFNVASLTKPMFALMTLHEVAKQNASLDAPLASDWVDPDVQDDPRSKELTARHVLSHQSGLPNWRGDRPLSFMFSPGERHEYSGEGFEYLRRALEKRSGKPMRELMQADVIAPLKLEHTWFGWDPAVGDNIAQGYNPRGQAYLSSNLDERKPNAAANTLTTISDYATFAAWVVRGADLPAPLFRDMQLAQTTRTPPAEHFGLGWRVTEVNGQTVISHDGREPGVRTQVFLRPNSGDGLLILTSSDNGELLTRPLVRAALPQGDALLAAIDAEIWTYLQQVPAQHVSGLASKIAGSATFMSKALHAAETRVFGHAPGSGEHAAIDQFVTAMLDGEVSTERATQTVALLMAGESGWRNEASPELIAQWSKALTERDAPASERAAVELSDAQIAGLLGTYRVGSSNLPITIQRGDSGIEANAPGMPIVKLIAESSTRFSMKEDSTQFEFVPGDDGKASGLRVIWSGGRSELAPREM